MRKSNLITESWKTPNHKTLQKHSKDLALSNLSKRIEDEIGVKSISQINTFPNLNLDISACETKRSRDNVSIKIDSNSILDDKFFN